MYCTQAPLWVGFPQTPPTQRKGAWVMSLICPLAQQKRELKKHEMVLSLLQYFHCRQKRLKMRRIEPSKQSTKWPRERYVISHCRYSDSVSHTLPVATPTTSVVISVTTKHLWHCNGNHRIYCRDVLCAWYHHSLWHVGNYVDIFQG